MIHRNKKILFMIFISLTFFSIFACAAESNNTKIAYYKNGGLIPFNERYVEEAENNLIDTCEGLLTSGKDTYKIIITKELFLKFKKSELLEIEYDTPKEFKLYNKVITVKRILLPLEGRFSKYPTLFYETHPLNKKGVIVNREGKDKLESIVELIHKVRMKN